MVVDGPVDEGRAATYGGGVEFRGEAKTSQRASQRLTPPPLAQPRGGACGWQPGEGRRTAHTPTRYTNAELDGHWTVDSSGH